MTDVKHGEARKLRASTGRLDDRFHGHGRPMFRTLADDARVSDRLGSCSVQHQPGAQQIPVEGMIPAELPFAKKKC